MRFALAGGAVALATQVALVTTEKIASVPFAAAASMMGAFCGVAAAKVWKGLSDVPGLVSLPAGLT